MGLTAADIASMQAISKAYTMTTACTISRVARSSDGYGGVSENWSTIATTVCSVAPHLTIDKERVEEGRMELVSAWIIGLPAGTDVTEKDRIVAGGITYEVARVRDPRTIEIARDCICYVVR